MGGSSKHKERYQKSNETSDNQGTAARTRPLSFDEIMSRRKNKKLSENEKAGAVEDSGDGIVHNASDLGESGRGNGHSKDLSPAIQKPLVEEHAKGSSRKRQENNFRNDDAKGKGGEIGDSGDGIAQNVSDLGASKKGNENRKDLSLPFQKPLVEEHAKGSSRKRRENRSGKDDVKGKGRETGDLEVKLRDKMKKDISNEAKSKISEKIHARKNEDWPVNDYENETSKKNSRDSIRKDGHAEVIRIKSVVEYRRKSDADETIHVRRKGDARPSSENEAGKRHQRDLPRKNGNTDESRRKSEIENKRKYHDGVDEKNRDKNDNKKYELRKGHHLDTLDRKERKELSKSHVEEERIRRRRSRSGEREKRKRSISLSPRAPKHSSYHDREHGEPSSHSLKGRSGHQHSDIERNKLSHNGLSSHLRRHGGSSSGLGGYSPRKRRTEAAAKTPSPTRRSPEKKRAKWDLAPELKGNSVPAVVPTNSQKANGAAPLHISEVFSVVPVASTTINPVSVVSTSVLSTIKSASTDTIQLTQASRPLRRLYMENLPASASERSVKEFLNNLLISSGANYVQGTEPCLNCIIHKEKGQALVEFLTPEDATIALSFDCSSFSGSVVKIRRPKDFVDVATGEPEKSVAFVDSVSNVVKDSPNKLMEIASAFGPLKAYQFESKEDTGDAFAFLEYADKSVTPKACAGLNGMKLGGKVITVVQAVPNASSLESGQNPPFCGIPEHAKPLLETPTQVLKLQNVFDVEALPSLSHTEIEEVLEDVRLECARFGAVESINVVKHDASFISTSKAGVVNDDMVSAGISEKILNLETDETIAKIEPLQGGDDKIVEGNSLGKRNSGDLLEDELCRPETVDHNILEGNSDLIEDESHQPEFLGHKLVNASSIDDEKPIGNFMKDEPCQPESVEGSKNDDNKPMGNLIEVNPCLQRHLDSDTAAVDFDCKHITDSQQLHEQHHASERLLDCSDDKITASIQMNKAAENESLVAEQLNLEEVSREVKNVPIANSVDKASDAIRKEDREELDHTLDDIFEQGCVYVEFRRTEASCMAAHCLHGRTFDDRVVTVRYIPLDTYVARFPR